MSTPRRRSHEQWLLELTAIPTAAGREQRVIAWVEDWVRRRRNLRIRRDEAGNLLITRAGRGAGRPIYITAHLDHPAFVVRRTRCGGDDRVVELEFRGGVHDAYFEDAPIEIFDSEDHAHRGRIIELKPKAKPYKRVLVKLGRAARAIAPGDVGRWALGGRLPRITGDMLHTYACDDLAAVAAALATLDRLKSAPQKVGVLLTRAEEVGFIGTLAACTNGSIPKTARLICLENSRSFPESPIGAGPILRVGDKVSVFGPTLTNRLGAIMLAHQKKNPGLRWQRCLMPGGTCEATAFSVYGYESTCVCLPLGNYHNMSDIDGVLAGRRPAKVGPEHISISDYHGMIEMLTLCVRQLDSDRLPSMRQWLDDLLRDHRHVLETPPAG